MASEIYEKEINGGYKTYLPAAIAVVGAILMLLGRLEIGSSFISDGALMMLALASYILAALFLSHQPVRAIGNGPKDRAFTSVLGVFFNLSSWLVRWDAAYEHEIAIMRESGNMATPWIFRYVPFANLYDLSLAFAFGAGFRHCCFRGGRISAYSPASRFRLPH